MMTTSHSTIESIHHSHLSYEIAKHIQTGAHEAFCIIYENNTMATHALNEIKLFLDQKEHDRLLVLPDWETLPYDHINAHKNIIAQRIQTLYRLTQIKNPILVLSTVAYGRRYAPRSFILKESFICHVGQKMTIENFRNHMLAKGYHEAREVNDIGQFSIRGSILDMVLTDKKISSYRIELFDDEIDSIRYLDISTNRSNQLLEKIHIQPNQEFIIGNESKKTIQKNINLCPVHLQEKLEKLLENAEHLQGRDYYLAFFHETLETVHDYLPTNCLIIQPENLGEAQQRAYENAKQSYQKQIDHHRPIAHPDSFINRELSKGSRQHLRYRTADSHDQVKALPVLSHQKKTIDENPDLQRLFKDHKKMTIFAPGDTRADNLYHCLHSTTFPCTRIKSDQKNNHTKPSIKICTGNLKTGFICTQAAQVYISENDLLGRILSPEEQTLRKSLDSEQIESWKVGTLIVHRDYGIGKFLEFTTIENDGKENDFLVLSYAGDDKLYVATNQFHLLSRYIGAQTKKPILTSLDGKKWKQKKKKAMEQADLLAEKLLSQHALRKRSEAKQLKVSSHDLAQFCEYFPYTETPDQKKAVDTILQDLQKSTAMNRLLCGDVGFGKTEVALRAAFACVYSGHQAAVLSPTTLLTKQHLETFTQRFSHFPIKIAMISRLTSKEEQDTNKRMLKSGEIDIVIATHGLLQPDIEFKSLGLFIIDEEHKFGVKQKELIKAISSKAHTLAMSATPIPRTLHMTMAKLRDISIIATPPKNRQSIQTFVEVYADHIVQEAIQREHQRGGQCYVIHNDIRSLEIIKENIERLLPEISCRIMHAKQPKKILEATMLSFQQGDFDVLLATTIVESGIDIPGANTIIIQRADLLGLSQIHQLRGRVGRSHHQAYAYLLTPDPKHMTDEGCARMKSISRQKQLGSGLNIALEDLEIRGAGDLLGKKQSGTAEEVGLSLYNEMLAKATQKRQGEPDQVSSSQIEVDLGVNCSLPETYIKDFTNRLNFYRVISCAEDMKTLTSIKLRLEDQYGILPEKTSNLLEIRRVQQLACILGINKIVAKDKHIDIWIADMHKIKHLMKRTAVGQCEIRIIGNKMRIFITDKQKDMAAYLISALSESTEDL